MAELRWDEWLKAADETGFSPIPVGTYDMYVDSCTAAQSSSGKNMLKLTLKVESGPHEGSRVFTNMVISPESPAALGFLIRKLNALGLDREYLSENPSLEKIASDLENRRCVAEVVQREFGGSMRNDINSVRPPADGVTHHASGSIPADGLGVFASGGLALGKMGMSGTVHVENPAHPGHTPHHAGKGPELPF